MVNLAVLSMLLVRVVLLTNASLRRTATDLLEELQHLRFTAHAGYGILALCP